ncbi:MAG TPA: hypothetical protein VGQ83_08810 [Polyangia bacterium]
MFLVLPLVFAVGCGDDNVAPKQDAGQNDAPLQNDTGVQQDTAPQDVRQSDAPVNQPGQVIVTQVSPAPVGVPQLDGLKFPIVTASWTPVAATGNSPTATLDKRDALGLGCVAYYYNFLAAGTKYVDTTANAGTVTVKGPWTGVQINPDGDAGAPIPNPITCNRTESPADAGTFVYNCDYPRLPVFPEFVKPGDKVFVNVSGSDEVQPTLMDGGLTVPPFVHVTTALPTTPPTPALYAIDQVPVGDAGIGLDFECGKTDAGTGGNCQLVTGILIQSSDTAPPAPLGGAIRIQDNPPTAEFGYIQCSKLSPPNNHMDIDYALWTTAFPVTSQWRSLRTVVTHLAPQLAKTLIGVGGGEVGVTARTPDAGP